MYHGSHMGFFPFGFGWISWILLIFVIGIVIYFFLKKNNISDNRKETAVELLEKRFAKGEISKEEFIEKKKVLRGGNNV